MDKKSRNKGHNRTYASLPLKSDSKLPEKVLEKVLSPKKSRRVKSFSEERTKENGSIRNKLKVSKSARYSKIHSDSISKADSRINLND